MKHNTLKQLSIISIFVYMVSAWTLSAQAFPFMVTHGYANCVACHVSPTGGGVMTAYGRSLSEALLSHWGYKGEEKAAYLVNEPKWLRLGGDFRAIQTYENSTQTKNADFFPMQEDLEAAVQVGRWTVDATAGLQGGPTGTPKLGEFLSRRHFIAYHPTDTTSIRVGRFLAQYGINHANHTIFTRGPLGFGQGDETYNAELAYLGENNDAYFTVLMGRPDDPKADGQHGVAVSASHYFLDRMKVGVSALNGHTDFDNRNLAGVWGILGLTPSVYVESEIDHQWSVPTGQSEQRGIVSYNQLNYEFTQGFHVYIDQQLDYQDFQNVLTRNDSWGVGIQAFPRPHLDFEAEFDKQRLLAQSPIYEDFAWVLLHVYL